MKEIRISFIALIFVFLNSCDRKVNQLTTLNFEKDLIPEGIAIDLESRTVFLNSLRKNKIVQCKLNGSNPKAFIKSNQHGYLSGFGMTIKGDTLFALGNSLPKVNNKSILLLLNIKTGNLINSYSNDELSFKYLNDLAISKNDDIYITDSESNKLYTVQKSKGALEVYLENDEIAHSNGICISDDNKYLYLASYSTGIRVIDLISKKILNKPNLDNTGIDGMKFYNNSLIGIVNTKKDLSKRGVFRYYLDKTKTKIIRKEKIVPYGKHFIFPTTFEIIDGHIFYIINSQLNNFDGESNQVINKNELVSYQLMKKKI